jgi:hypothetical protein
MIGTNKIAVMTADDVHLIGAWYDVDGVQYSNLYWDYSNYDYKWGCGKGTNCVSFDTRSKSIYEDYDDYDILPTKDDIEFLFSANGDKKPIPLQKVASGGELSRIMLCIKALMAEYTGMPTMIFDEIDTGVSGSIADKMGTLIGKMGESMQIFAITHLPQIASKGKTHLLVYKEFENNVAKSRIREITGEERVTEIARMLSGSELSQAAIANAKELLGN